ncbi:hypothetical protein C2845_PM01G18340 [Panicum miliaceum]|uniref:Uncharacterized protein n=1 Tax=Panicum miliaceum TaxID=4540 RepID=A0A3L6TSD1_PANMI|nr:hypothetical protein C2845_PM01G18340 [Panicum miliaceum]
MASHSLCLSGTVWQNDQDIMPTYELEEVWVRITGVPHAYRHYMILWAVGTVIGETLEVDMLTNRKKGVIRVKVGILDKRQLPHTTDLVFGTQGYHVTFTQEEESFLPATLPPEDDDPMDFDDFGGGNGSAEDKERDALAKELKSDSQNQSNLPQTNNIGFGPAPMQCSIAITPMGNCRKCPPRKPVVLDGLAKLHKIAVTVPIGGFWPGCGIINGAQPDMVADTSTEEDVQPPLSSGNGNKSDTHDGQANVALGTKTNGLCSNLFEPALEEVHPISPSCATGIFVPPSSGPSEMASPTTLRRSLGEQAAMVGIIEADELMMDKAMRRASSRNLDSAAVVPAKSPAARSQTGAGGGGDKVLAVAQHIVRSLATSKNATDYMIRILSSLDNRLSSITNEHLFPSPDPSSDSGSAFDAADQLIQLWDATPEVLVFEAPEDDVAQYITALTSPSSTSREGPRRRARASPCSSPWRGSRRSCTTSWSATPC